MLSKFGMISFCSCALATHDGPLSVQFAAELWLHCQLGSIQPSAKSRVERWRGGLGVAYLFPALSSDGPSKGP